MQPPETFDDLTAIAEKVMAANPDMSGFLWPGAKDEALVMVWASMLYGFGGKYFDDAGKCAVNSPEGVGSQSSTWSMPWRPGCRPQRQLRGRQEEARTRFAGGNGLFLYSNADMVNWLDNPGEIRDCRQVGAHSAACPARRAQARASRAALPLPSTRLPTTWTKR